MTSVMYLVFIFLSFHSLDCLNDINIINSRLTFFDIDLLRYSTDSHSGNVVISPASIKSTLAMLLEGAIGDTASEIGSALRLSPSREEFREQLNVYLNALQSNDTESHLENANAVFVSNNLKLKKGFEALLQGVYGTKVFKLNFKDPLPATKAINKWANDTTKGLIPSLIEPIHINPSSNIMITNALYFQSTWEHSFHPRMTHGACFYHQGICKNVAMMELYAELNYAYIENLRAHAVELPYTGRRYSMILLVPQDRGGCMDVIRDLPYMSLPQIIKLMEPVDVQLSLPKFTIDFSEDMVEVLQKMRITSLFSSTSNLSGIFDSEATQINSINHKVHMSVDEKGTVAAAASIAMVIPLIENGAHLRVDRPFVFFIRDNKLGLIVFEGRIVEPTAFTSQNGVDVAAKKFGSFF